MTPDPYTPAVGDRLALARELGAVVLLVAGIVALAVIAFRVDVLAGAALLSVYAIAAGVGLGMSR